MLQLLQDSNIFQEVLAELETKLAIHTVARGACQYQIMQISSTHLTMEHIANCINHRLMAPSKVNQLQLELSYRMQLQEMKTIKKAKIPILMKSLLISILQSNLRDKEKEKSSISVMAVWLAMLTKADLLHSKTYHW